MTKRDADVVMVERLRRGPSYMAEELREGGVFDTYLANLQEFARGATDGLSPRRLVETGPLAVISEPMRGEIANALHAWYLRASGIEDTLRDVERSTTAMSEAVVALREVWVSQGATALELRSAFEAMQTAGEDLYATLGRTPTGIVVP